jgi:excisionase family DNA binding protein
VGRCRGTRAIGRSRFSGHDSVAYPLGCPDRPPQPHFSPVVSPRSLRNYPSRQVWRLIPIGGFGFDWGSCRPSRALLSCWSSSPQCGDVVRKRTYTIKEAAELTGLSQKAIARRVERGSLRSLVRGGRRLIPRAELVRAELVPAEGDIGESDFEPLELLPHRDSALAVDESAFGTLFRELLNRLERQAGEIAHYRALTAQAESLRLERELAELRGRLNHLERQPSSLGLGAGPSEPPPEQPSGMLGRLPSSQQRSAQGIWLPPSAIGSPGRLEGRRHTGHPPASVSRGPGLHPLGRRLLILMAEALFIVCVAVLVWLAELRPAFVIATVTASWFLVAFIEWRGWRVDHGSTSSGESS